MDKPGAKGRESSKERHRQMLIDATAAAIAEHGLAQVSVSRILENTGLSRGMINLHFATKQKLLVEVARHFSDQYIGSWNSAIAAAGPRPEDRLRAVIEADFDPSVLNRRTMAVWFAFRGEAHSVPDYMPFIDSREARMNRVIYGICTDLCAQGPYPDVDPRRAANSFIAALEGLWTDFHLHPDDFRREEAREVVLEMARAYFPRQFRG